MGKSSGAGAARDAAEIQAQYGLAALAEQQRQFDQTQALLAPFIGAGYGALPYTLQGATAGGLSARLSEIMGYPQNPPGAPAMDNFAPKPPVMAQPKGGVTFGGGGTGTGGFAGGFTDRDFELPEGVMRPPTPPPSATPLPTGAIPQANGTFRPFQDLVNERMNAANAQLSQAGLTRSGAAARAAAAIPTDLALQIENLLYGRQAALSGFGQNASVQQGAFGQQTAANIGNITSGVGDAIGQGIIGQAQARAQNQQNTINTVLSAAAIYFSDPRLKKNMEPIGAIGPLTLYEWDWIDEVSPIVGKMNIGFSADEVKAKLPQFVVEVAGFLAINYPALTDHLKALLSAPQEA